MQGQSLDRGSAEKLDTTWGYRVRRRERADSPLRHQTFTASYSAAASPCASSLWPAGATLSDTRDAKPMAIVPRFPGGGAPMRVVCLALVLATVVSVATGSAAAANYTQETLDRYLRIEYQVEPSAAQPVVSGYVYNLHPGLPADRLQLAIDALDASGEVVGT